MLCSRLKDFYQVSLSKVLSEVACFTIENVSVDELYQDLMVIAIR